MTSVAPWVAILTSVLVVLGAAVTLIGAIGTLRLRTFFDRMHAPGLGAGLGLMLILLASMLFFSALEGRLVLREIVVGFFIAVTAPVTLMLLGRAALYRERMEQATHVPPIAAVAKGRRKSKKAEDKA